MWTKHNKGLFLALQSLLAVSLYRMACFCFRMNQQQPPLYHHPSISHDSTLGGKVAQQLSTLESSSSSSHLLLPIIPSLLKKVDDNNNDNNNSTASSEAAKAMEDVFRYTTTTTKEGASGGSGGGGWIDVNALSYDDIATLRHLGATIMSRNLTCGRPHVLGESISPELEYCFWQGDYVSNEANSNFAFEPHLWGWVLQQFRDLDQDLAKYNLSSSSTECHLAFLDIGVNVADWASPLRLAMPIHTPYFGIEGTPSTGAIAAANMRTSIEHLRATNRSAVAPTALLPFALVSKGMIQHVREAKGVCFDQRPNNVGGQGVESILGNEGGKEGEGSGNQAECLPSQTAGGTLLPHALKALVPLQPACPGKQDWPRIYVAKLDVEGFEFKALMSAIDWLAERPPCYLMIEFHPIPQVSGIMELFLDIGYDSLWQVWQSNFPPDTPYWSSSQNRSLHSAVQADLVHETDVEGYRDYVFGFGNKEKCLRQLLE